MSRDVRIAILGDARDFSRAAKDASDSAARMGGGFSRLSSLAKAGMASAGLAVGAFAKSSINAFVQAEESQAQLDNAFKKFPQLAKGNIDALRGLNSQLALKTKFDDDATASGQAVLAQFGLTQKQLTEVTPLLQDYAAKTGKDLPTAARDVGKAVLGQGRALKAVGLELKDTGSAAGNFEQLMGGLSKQVGGFAENQGKTASGQAQILKNQFGELQEEIGSRLVPALLKAATFITATVVPAVRTIGDWLKEHKPVLIAVASVIGVGLVAAFTAWATSAAAAAAATIAATAPVIAIVAAIAALVAGVIYAYQNWDLFRNAVDAVASFVTGTLWPALQSVASFFTDTLVPAIGGAISWIRDNWQLLLAIFTGPIGLAAKFITDHFDQIVTFITGLPGRIATAASGMFDGIQDAFKGAINWIIKAWNGLDFKIPGFDPPGPGPKFGGFTLGVPDIPTLHDGGVYRSRAGEGLAMLRDGEGVFTPEQMQAMGGFTVNQHFHGSVDRDVVADSIYELKKVALRVAA